MDAWVNPNATNIACSILVFEAIDCFGFTSELVDDFTTPRANSDTATQLWVEWFQITLKILFIKDSLRSYWN